MILNLANTAIVVGAILIILSYSLFPVVSMLGMGMVLVGVGAFVWQRNRRTIERDDVV